MSFVEVALPNEQFEQVNIYVNNTLVLSKENCSSAKAEITEYPANVVIEFQPFKIKPIVRYQNFMLDYWLANIQLFDHMLELTVADTFFIDYKNKNIQGRINSLSNSQQNDEHLYDLYIGVDNLYPNLVEEIKKLIQ